MINKENIKDLLIALHFEKQGNIYQKHFSQGDFYLKVDFDKKILIYPEQLKIGGEFTTNFSSDENFVVFECVNRLLSKGYKPQHIELEPKWKVGHGASGGRADIFIRDQENQPLLIIECKTAEKEFKKEWKEMELDGGQLFTYIEQEKATKFVCLYASSFDEKTNEITLEQRIVSHKDNEQILKDDPTLKSFKDAQNVKERYKVWKDTYKLEFTETGIFEDNILAYQIGKDKYTLEIDTKIIDATDKRGKYHQFRKILRKYNVSRRENAFEVLVNLFLCKIVDETENPNDLKFYWKGIAYDSYYDLVDRLQELYKIGMQRFLQQDIVYISSAEIDGAFWAVKGEKGNVTKQRIKDLFKELKFYKGLDFEFIKVFNKRYFEKNAKILLEIIQMWQGLRLKTKEQNQFLGDMFEFFLDNGIKQSEGQFFTPVPICKFIVASLPLENYIQSKKEPLLAIDYACGSGHFLTEYALQIKPFIKKHKQVAPSEYYKNIFGIEKEDRLAKVAKVSAFMYGQEEINIIDADALAPHEDIKTESFDVLVANPPFAVEDFLMTLEDHTEDYDLFKTVSDIGNKNIQCFFLERSKQLLAPNGVAGIIIPSSILSNSDTMHIKTRELLLQYFDFVSITELGSGTFGKTGTNTVVLFLRRKANRPEPAKLYWERTINFFENWEEELETNGSEYQDLQIVKTYCQHISVLFEDYQQLFLKSREGLVTLLKYDMFKEYKADFDNQTEIKKLLEGKQFKLKSKEEQESELNNRFFNYLHDIEKQKMYFFMLAFHNPAKVLIVKSPSDNKEQKQFLGYEWSSAKGGEGIKYNGGDTVYDIVTPLFDPKNTDNTEKINFLIQQNFLEKPIADVPEYLQSFVSYANLVDLLDFSRKEFNKGFSLTPKNMKPIATKWDLVKISEAFLEVRNGKSVEQSDTVGKFKVSRIESIAKGIFDTDAVKWTNDKLKEEDFLQKGDILFSHINSVSHLAKTAIFNLDEKIVHGINLLKFRPNPTILIPAFAAEIFKLSEFTNEIKAQAQKAINQASVNTSYLNELKIPLPPLSIQQQIVAECEAIDKAVEKAKEEVLQGTRTINEIVGSIYQKEYAIKRLSDICKMQAGKFVSASDISDDGDKNSYPCYGGNGLRGYTKTFTHEGEYSLIGRQGALCGNLNKSINGKFHATEHAVVVTPNSDIDTNWLFHQLKSLNLNQYATGTAQPGLSVKTILTVKIPVPPLSEQQALVTEIEKIELQIASNQAIIDKSGNEKQAIMKKYL
jgi:type I restriction enzyme M protein